MRNTRFNSMFLRTLPREVQMTRLRQVIQKELTDLQRYTLTAYYFEEKTLEEIAKHRGVNKTTIWRTLKRAEEKLRRFLCY